MNSTATPLITARERFNRAARCQPVDRPPLWLMRQAGRQMNFLKESTSRHFFLA